MPCATAPATLPACPARWLTEGSGSARQAFQQAGYSPAECIGTKTKVVSGNPDDRHISTPFAERQNLNLRMHMRRFTRLTNAFSKKVENHELNVALFATYACDGRRRDGSALGDWRYRWTDRGRGSKIASEARPLQ